ncbi:outer membrane beta-barrel protein [uncultured Microbulbifer sp.]|uniref:outer membrane beta-barrel protein n=1 Tax=uncultured Microbulbifer sp. TaxID=348147 RepID=UPI0025CD5CCF|nr:outer membrane beta-barrel protein [uncultured Microbulbifer sp.]
MVRPHLLLVVPAVLLANTASADFYSHRYGGISLLDSELSGFCSQVQSFVSNLNSEEQQASARQCKEQGTGWKLYSGWQWTPFLAVEADLRQNPDSSIRFDVSNPALPHLGVHDRVSNRMGNLFFVGHLPVSGNGLSVFGKLGGGFWLSQITERQEGEVILQVRMEDDSLQEVVAPVSAKLSENDSGFHWGYGAGISYRHRNNWTLRAEWEVFPEVGSDKLRAEYDVQTTSLGWSFHF